jgi:hypothetical protein
LYVPKIDIGYVQASVLSPWRVFREGLQVF